jgi:mono/diheme cytochrome c family protein
MAKTTRRSNRSWKKTLLWVIGICVVVFIVIQFIPYGRSSHSNPAATNAFQWTDPQAEAIAKTSCYDCHSNETRWWWATDIAPFSWLVQHDVDDGRARLNFSEFDGLPPADELQRVVEGGEMPPFQYTLIHRNAKLTDAQKQTLIAGYAAGVAAMSGSSSGSGGSTTSSSSPTPTASATASTTDATAVIQQDCSSCHSSDPALAFTASNTGEAQALIDDMIQRGAQVSSQDQTILVQYFTR